MKLTRLSTTCGHRVPKGGRGGGLAAEPKVGDEVRAPFGGPLLLLLCGVGAQAVAHNEWGGCECNPRNLSMNSFFEEWSTLPTQMLTKRVTHLRGYVYRD